MNTKKFAFFTSMMLALSIGIRCFFFPQELGHYDSFNFAFALDFYNLPLLSPHFPGYPWYIVIAKCLYFLGCSKVVSLILPGLIASILSLGILWKIAGYYHFSNSQRFFLLLFYTWNPLISIVSLKAFSDSLALFIFLMSFEASLQGHAKIAAFFLAIGVGVRPSYLILGIPILWLNRYHVRSFTKNFVLALLPLLFFYMRYLSWNEVTLFLSGHFTRWGGTLWSRPSFLKFLLIFLGLPLFLSFWKRPRLRFFFPLEIKHWFFSYSLWILVAQNLSNPRHFFPLIFPLTIVFIGNIRRGFWVLFFLLILCSIWTSSILKELQQPSLYTKFSDIVIKQYTPLEVKIYGGKSLRVFDQVSFWQWNKKNVVHFSEIQDDLTTIEYWPPVILITSEVREIPLFWKECAEFNTKLKCPFWNYAPEHEMEVYHFSQKALHQLLHKGRK